MAQKDDDKAKRLAQALRANLRRRKNQAREAPEQPAPAAKDKSSD